MVMIITHIADITCLLANDGWHAHVVIGVNKVHPGAGRVSCFTDQAILWLVDTVMGEAGARSI